MYMYKRVSVDYTTYVKYLSDFKSTKICSEYYKEPREGKGAGARRDRKRYRFWLLVSNVAGSDVIYAD